MKPIPPVKSLNRHLTRLSKTTPEKTALVACNEKGETEREITYAQLKEEIHEIRVLAF